MSNDPGHWSAIHAQRHRLADLLDTLTPLHWEAPSVCAGWRVRDVAAHVASAPLLRVRDVGGMVWRGRFNFDRMVLLDGLARGRAAPEEIRHSLREHADSRNRLPGSYPLIDVVVHTHDITRALGIGWETPPGVAATAAEQARPLARLMGAGKVLRAVRLEATDADWATGRGPTVAGPAQELLLVLCGRARVARDLTGPGVPVLSAL